ncbi:hypothetical protein GCM10010495_55290 [Kitasatospora herbaricolor]|uniref:maleylpyruvate isomerase family mycothiol-dependent enzyme n=1 Tax=Kitasatospora herbaricolor TaxID=68217 RepID=UPI00174B8409|nr:maleylpyruvate isomerase family mycothiol-dependent enzyme [Kitasatospora herbaricolor]MDQ0307263.1 uncharacterized protein (TIGR03083 family) [Kitasatospora herbaricolor]GGV31579.1 hypothetical protein GCM10010495_55290 [Kitasatospora herbaricolor]
MEINEHIEALDREGTLLADAAAATDLGAPVPTCPGWLLRDLVLHTGQVHRWAAAHVAQARTEPLDEAGQEAAWGPVPADAELVGWFRAGHAGLLDALRGAPADLDCWTFLPAPSPLAFWARRQAHETAVHRFDAEAAAGPTGPPAGTGPALDGIDELLRAMLVRPRAKLRSERPRTLAVRPTDGPTSWLVTITREPVTVALADGPADLTVTGPARDLFLLLWNRLRPEDVGCEGDRSLLDLWRETAVITWS